MFTGEGENRLGAGSTGSLTFHHTGRAFAMIGLCLKILLLSLVTLTLYRFWGRTEVRRYLWGHTVIDGEPLDYLGKGSELLVGFLIALFVYLIPLGIAYSAIFSFWPADEDTSAMAPGSIPWLLAVQVGFIYLIMVGLYQALRYRFSRTSWRGIRFALTGSAFAFGIKFLLLGLLNILFLGLLTPVMDLALFRSVAQNTWFGDKAFRFEGKALSLYGPFLLSYVLAALLIAGFGAAVSFAMQGAGIGGTDPGEAGPEATFRFLPYIIAGYVLFLLLLMLATSFYAARSLRVKGSGLRYESLAFSLDAHTFSYLWLMLSNLVLVTLTLGIALPIAELRRFQYIFRRLTTTGSVDLSKIGQSTGPRPRFGEGLAEAFGMGNV